MIFLIDYENVTSSGLDGIEKLTENDKVYIFYTAAQPSLTFEAHKAILSSKAVFSYFNVANGGKNALDFQLASFTGYLVARSEDRQIFIISGDKGFSFIWRFWENYEQGNLNIYTAASVSKALARTAGSIISEEMITDSVKISDVIPAAVPDTAKAPAEEPIPAADDISGDERADETPKAPAARIMSDDLTENIKEKPARRTPPTKSKKPAPERTVTADIKKCLTDAQIDVSKCGMVINLLANAADKQQFYTGMTKAFGMDKGLAVYKGLRADYTNLKRMVDEK